MEALYASIRSWGTEEEGNKPSSIRKGVDEYLEPTDPASLSANFAALFPEVASLLNSCIERKVILNEITEDNNYVLGDESNKTVKLHRLGRSMEESVSIFKSVVEAEQQNGGTQRKKLAENEDPASRSNHEQGIDKSSKRRKGA